MSSSNPNHSDNQQNLERVGNITDRLNSLTRHQFDSVVAAARKSTPGPSNLSDFEVAFIALQKNDPLTLHTLSSTPASGRGRGVRQLPFQEPNSYATQESKNTNHSTPSMGGRRSSRQAQMDDPRSTMEEPEKPPSGDHFPQFDNQVGDQNYEQQQQQHSAWSSSQNGGAEEVEELLSYHQPENQGNSGPASASVDAASFKGKGGGRGRGRGKGRAPKGKQNADISAGEDEVNGEGEGEGEGSFRARATKMDEAERKQQHKEVERRRREAINEGIVKLSQIVPDCDPKTTHKGVIINKAVEYINHLKKAETDNIDKWTLEKLLMDRAMNSLNEELRDSRRIIENLREEREVLMGAGVKVDTHQSHHDYGIGNGRAGGSGDHGDNGDNGDNVDEESSRKRQRI